MLVDFFSLLHYNNLNSPWERDEGEYAYSAWLMEQGKLPYVNSFLLKPPLIVYTYYLSNKINPDAYWPPHLLGALFTFLTIVLISLIVRKEFGNKAAIAALWLGPPMFLFPPLSPFAANTEKFMLLPVVGVFAVYIWNKNNNKHWPWLLAGILSGIALLYKQVALLVLLTIIIAWCYSDFNRNRDIKAISCKIAIGLFGLISIAFIGLLPIILNGGWSAMWECIFTFSQNYMAALSKTIPISFIKYSTIFLKTWWILIFLSALSVLFVFKKIRLIILLFIVSLATVFKNLAAHYYLFLMPFWLILVAVGISFIWEKIFPNKVNWQRPIILVTLTAIICILYWPIKNQFQYSSEYFPLYLYGRENPFFESKMAAEEIKKITKENDRIFIMGSEPQIYYYAKRLSSSRFNIIYPLNFDTPARETYQKQAVADLERFPPAAIVVVRNNISHLWEKGAPLILVDYLKMQLQKNYRLLGGFCWLPNGYGYWKNNSNIDALRSANILLFQRRE